jgi:EAL and modified HD-GYP domain-containing signal transduction protein
MPKRVIIPEKSSTEGQSDTGLDVFVARQPIFSRNLEVYGYELLYRGGPSDSFDGTASDLATARVIAHTFLTIGAEKLLNGKIPFINFDSSLLLEHASVLPFPYAVFEILENVKPTDDVLAACRELKKKGYKLALDDVVTEARIEPWLDVIDIVKVDFLSADPQALKALAARCKERKIQALAEKVETRADHESAVSLGYDYFQGFFFGRPTVVQGRTMSETKLVLVQLLRELSADEVDFDRVEPLMQRNVSLVYKLLRFVNSPLFAWRSQIKSVRHAMALIGEEELRKWLCLLVVAGLGTGTVPQLLVDSLVRARFAELVSEKTRLSRKRSSAFLLGLLSHLDAILHRPMEEIIAELDLEQDLASALLGRATEENKLGMLYELIQAYERVDWIRTAAIGEGLNVGPGDVSSAYVKAVEWADIAAKP